MVKIDLSSRTILMTGARGAIAGFVVRRLKQAGATVIGTDIAKSDYRMDVTKPDEVARVVRKIFAKYPGLDIALGHAGGCGLHPFATTSAREFDRIFGFNFHGQVYFARAVLAEWVKRKTKGHLIFTSSYVARVPHTRIPAYASAKAALENFMKCLALEYAGDGIRVNCISPGNVAAGSSLKVFEQDREYRDFVLRVSPLGRRNSPEAIANAFLYLCSSLGDELNGHVLRVDLGVSIPKI